MNEKEIKEKLIELNNILSEKNELTEKFFSTNGIENRYQQIKDTLGRFDNIPSVFDSMPTIELVEDANIIYEQDKKKSTKYLLICGLFTVVAFLIQKIIYVKLINYAFVIGLLATGYFLFEYITNNNRISKEKSRVHIANQTNDQEFNKFCEALKTYEQEKQDGIIALEKYEENYSAAWNKYKKILSEYKSDEKNATARQEELSKTAEEYTFLPKEYWHLSADILKLLNSGRADTYKEALNLAIAEEKDENERKRREMAQLAMMKAELELLNQKQEEERRHNEIIEEQQAIANRLQAEQNKAFQEAEKKRANEEIRAQKLAHEEQFAAEQNQLKICWKCAHYGRCHGKIVGCGSFTPK